MQRERAIAYDAEAVRRNARRVIATVAEHPGGDGTPQGAVKQMCRVVTAGSQLADSHVSDLVESAKELRKVAEEYAEATKRQMWIIALIMLAQLIVLAFLK